MGKSIVQAEASKLAQRFGINAAPEEIIDTLKATVFKGQVSDSQLAALMVVAGQYGLNPWTKEIYAFPDRNNGIVPVVGVDGWSRIINEHPMFDGMEFEFAEDFSSCTCTIYRKDRSHPIRVTEYMNECSREGPGPWKTHPKRMLRHKAMIQCARLAFGFAGIYDPDEAERVVEMIDAQTGEVVKKEPQRPAIEHYPEEKFEKNLPAWRSLIESGKKTAEEIIISISSRATLSDDQIRRIKNLEPLEMNAGEPVAEEA